MIYPLLRSAAAVALRWYYADVTIVGADRVPPNGPILVAVNHPNALVDVLVSARAVRRPLRFTAKATLFEHPAVALLFRAIGVLPLRRASDEAAAGKTADPARNAQAFDAVANALARSEAILIFPEGKSHDDPSMAPARTGAARMVLHARNNRLVAGIRIVPIGLIFERKERPRSRILAVVGDPFEIDPIVAMSHDPVAALTTALESRLRALTLNYESIDDAERDARVARAIEAVLRIHAPAVSRPGDLELRAAIAKLLPALRASLMSSDSPRKSSAESLEQELLAFDELLTRSKLSPDDLTISRDVGPGVVFTLREAGVLLLAGPVALWGWLNHELPFRAALLAGKRAKKSDVDPAMRTIVAGAMFILMTYMLQGAAVALLAGPWWGLAYVASLPLAADVNLRMRDRLHRAGRRARTYLLFRARPSIQDKLSARAKALRSAVITLGEAAGIRGESLSAG